MAVFHNKKNISEISDDLLKKCNLSLSIYDADTGDLSIRNQGHSSQHLKVLKKTVGSEVLWYPLIPRFVSVGFTSGS